MKKTKIICTIGPASDTKEKIAALTDAGCDVVRLNFSHGTHEDYAKKIKTIKQVREEKHVPLPILLDTKGPEFRIKTFENDQDRRKCRYIQPHELGEVIKLSLERSKMPVQTEQADKEGKKLPLVLSVGSAPMDMARGVGERVLEIGLDTPERMVERIQAEDPDAVLWASDAQSKACAAQVAALMRLGLCADCTLLETDGEQLLMYRPAFSGNIIAKIRSTTRPAMASVRTASGDHTPVVVGVGMGAVAHMEDVRRWADGLGAALVATRLTVDHDHMPYPLQVGLTGKSISPDVYIALGVSGAVHHIAGVRSARTIIAVNKDKDAPIFDYADYGVVADIEDVLS